jgi:DNA-binding transcriptional ArsR family regulator
MKPDNKANKIIKSAALLKAIGHPIRVKIIRCLSSSIFMTVTELSELLSIDQPVISLHLGVLRKHNVIKVRKDGKKSIYSIANISTQQIINITYNTINT